METVQPPLVQLVPEKSRAGVGWQVAATLSAAVNVTALISICSGISSFRAGQRNLTPVFIFSRVDAVWALIWVISTLLLACLALSTKGATRFLSRGCLVVCIAAIPSSCSTRALPYERYTAGLIEWTFHNVNADAIRKWNETLPSVSKATSIPAAQWPVTISVLSPDSIEQLPAQHGIVLKWGVPATWSTSRKVFIARDINNDLPPTDDFQFRWQMVRPGVYAEFEVYD
jgi:hypothetical protein